jgi:hypothetical protein
MATSMATSRAKAMAMAMAVAICRATWMEKTDGGKGNGNIGGKKHWQIRGGGKSTGGKFNGKNLGCEQKPLATHVATKGQTCIAGKSNSNTGSKAMAKIVARAKGWTCKWEITGKSRWHIA